MKTKIKHLLSWQRLLALGALLALIAVSLIHPLYAQSITTGYNADIPMQRGMIIKLKKDDATKVELVTKDTAEEAHGIVVNANDAPVALAGDGQHVFVATIGHFEVLVSTQNGPLKTGDYIAVSSTPGIGMKAGDRDPIIAGRALGDFDGSKNVVSVIKLKDSDGAEKEAQIGRIEIDINVARNPLLKATEPNVPEILRKASESIAGKPVSTVRVYVSVIVFIVSSILALGLLYGGVRSAIISIGRNPLSKKSIVRGMLQVIVSGLIIFITGLFGVYLILRL